MQCSESLIWLGIACRCVIQRTMRLILLVYNDINKLQCFGNQFVLRTPEVCVVLDKGWLIGNEIGKARFLIRLWIWTVHDLNLGHLLSQKKIRCNDIEKRKKIKIAFLKMLFVSEKLFSIEEFLCSKSCLS